MSAMESDDAFPPIRFSPQVRRRLDEEQQAHPRHFTPPPRLDIDTSGINEKIHALSQSILEAEARASAAGYELGPLRFEHDSAGTAYRITATRDLIRREPVADEEAP